MAQEPDYEQIHADREEIRGEASLRRMDHQTGGDQLLYSTGPDRRCSCGKLWGEGQAAHGCRLLTPDPYAAKFPRISLHTG